MNYYLYYAYNNNNIIQQALFSILSLFQVDRLHERKDTKVIVYTDKPDIFKNFFKEACEFIDIRSMSMDEFSSWMVADGYTKKNIHRLKIKCIADVFEKDPSGKVILLDTDTYLLKSLQPCFAQLAVGGTTYMHKDEGPVFKSQKPGLRAHKRFLNSQNWVIDGKPYTAPKTFRMYNAGVVGIGPREQHLVPAMLKTQDDIYEQSQYYNSEQYVLSDVLMTKTKLLEADHLVRHYWYLKEFQETINRFNEKNKAKSFSELLVTPMPTTKMPSYEGFKKLSYNVPYKFKKKLFELNLLKSYVRFD